MTNTISVSYDYITRSADIEIVGSRDAWRAARRACQDSFGETEITGQMSLRMPWWAFLGCLNEIEYYAKRHKVPIDYAGGAVERLAQSKDAVARYESARIGVGPSEGEVRTALGTTGFRRELTAEQGRNVSRMMALPSAATFFRSWRRQNDGSAFLLRPKAYPGD